jgi:hypothetical protein
LKLICIFVNYSDLSLSLLKTTNQKISPVKSYYKPEVTRIILDNSISLVMMTTTPGNPPGPRGGGSKGADDPFKSPFGEKPFS